MKWLLQRFKRHMFFVWRNTSLVFYVSYSFLSFCLALIPSHQILPHIFLILVSSVLKFIICVVSCCSRAATPNRDQRRSGMMIAYDRNYSSWQYVVIRGERISLLRFFFRAFSHFTPLLITRSLALVGKTVGKKCVSDLCITWWIAYAWNGSRRERKRCEVV